MKAIKDIYEKYKHLDITFSDLSFTSDFRMKIIFDLWQAIKAANLERNEETNEKT